MTRRKLFAGLAAMLGMAWVRPAKAAQYRAMAQAAAAAAEDECLTSS
jgi:hypothetical protein